MFIGILSFLFNPTKKEEERRKINDKISKFRFADTAKNTARSLTPIVSVYTLLVFVKSAHTLLGPYILMLRLVDQTPLRCTYIQS